MQALLLPACLCTCKHQPATATMLLLLLSPAVAMQCYCAGDDFSIQNRLQGSKDRPLLLLLLLERQFPNWSPAQAGRDRAARKHSQEVAEMSVPLLYSARDSLE